MGLSPVDVDQMTLWQFQAVSDGYRRSHEEEKPPAMSDEDAARLGIEGF